MRKYGLYLFFPLGSDLKSEGLGRFLAFFLSASLEFSEVKFVIACPTWLVGALHTLFEDYKMDSSRFEIIGVERRPFFLRVLLSIICFAIKKRRKSAALHHNQDSVNPKQIDKSLFLKCINLSKKLLIKNISILRRMLFPTFVKTAILKWEIRCLDHEINRKKDIKAWYSPAAFWPQFNKIVTPKLVCVPDVVLNDFPIGFALHFAGMNNNYLDLKETILGAQFFATYSQNIKFNTLVKNYQIDPSKIFVVHHGANTLDHLIFLPNYNNDQELIRAHCSQLFEKACQQCLYFSSKFQDFKNLKFIFYASQVRANKNFLTLLRAYEYLLRNQLISHKLILTGDPQALPELWQFIINHRLENDVLWLRGISSADLAACYYLADLAVNPSLSEGGFPFTFTEAMSVGTPVVMGRINVTEEIIQDPTLNSMMLFDPYAWRDVANKIEWGLKNQEELFKRQKPLYEQLAKRTWKEVVAEYINLLDTISQ